jgi:hypothetical protein
MDILDASLSRSLRDGFFAAKPIATLFPRAKITRGVQSYQDNQITHLAFEIDFLHAIADNLVLTMFVFFHSQQISKRTHFVTVTAIIIF